MEVNIEIFHTTKLAGIVEESKDASDVFSSFAEVLSGSSKTFREYAEANQNLSDAIKGITEKAIINVDLLDLPGVKGAVNGIEIAGYSVSSIINDTMNGIGTSSGFSGDLSQQAELIESVVTAKRDLIKSVNNLKGVSGSAFKVVVFAGGVVIALQNSAEGIEKLITAMQSKISDAQGVDFSSVLLSLSHLVVVENDLVDAVDNLVNLGGFL